VKTLARKWWGPLMRLGTNARPDGEDRGVLRGEVGRRTINQPTTPRFEVASLASRW
jgi:hypothetical protein